MSRFGLFRVANKSWEDSGSVRLHFVNEENKEYFEMKSGWFRLNSEEEEGCVLPIVAINPDNLHFDMEDFAWSNK